MEKEMNRIVKIFMERDDETYEDALSMYKALRKEVNTIISECENSVEAYEYVEDELALYGLEMDYIMDLI